jgi:hypothetical protein
MNERELEIATKQLEHVRDEIARIEEDGEEAEFESNGAKRRVRRAELFRLYKREDELLGRISRLEGGSVSYSVASERR